MHADLVPSASFALRHEAERAQQILATCGIPSEIRGDDASGWAPHIGLATGGIALWVQRDRLEEAMRVLATAAE